MCRSACQSGRLVIRSILLSALGEIDCYLRRGSPSVYLWVDLAGWLAGWLLVSGAFISVSGSACVLLSMICSVLYRAGVAAVIVTALVTALGCIILYSTVISGSTSGHTIPESSRAVRCPPSSSALREHSLRVYCLQPYMVAELTEKNQLQAHSRAPPNEGLSDSCSTGCCSAGCCCRSMCCCRTSSRSLGIWAV